MSENQSSPESKVSYPLVQTTALLVSSKPTPMTSSKFVMNRIVKLKKESKFYALHPNPEESGQIIGPDPKREGWVCVLFAPSGYKNFFRIGMPSVDNGTCDLDVDEKLEQETFVTVTYAGQLMEFPVSSFTLSPGDTVLIDRKAERIVSVTKAIPSGFIAFVSRVIDDTFVIVDFQGNKKTIFAGKFSGKLQESGRVVLDVTGTVILENYGLNDDSFTVAESSVTWSNVHGQDDACQRFTEAVEEPFRYPELYKRLKKEAPNGVLVFGPPGCSKTMMMKAVFSQFLAMCKEKGVDGRKGFFLISGPEVLDKYIGSAEALIRNIFARANKFYTETSIRPMIVIDECEALLAKRDSGVSSDILKSIVPTFLAEWQGVRVSKAIVVGMTNKPNSLDSAVTRPGRLDIMIEVKRPTREASRLIFLDRLKGVEVSKTTTVDLLADAFVEEVFSPKRVMYDITRREGDKDISMPFTFVNILSGAMIPVIAEEAKRATFNRLKQAPSGTEFDGLRLEEVTGAVDIIFGQNFRLEHREALDEFVHDYAKDITACSKRIQILQ
ncbi:MAG: ATP-binding protein [Candidatus Pacebacteria bacterium]|nr:ATP-binding protein [Candidatus Paceibacterota bacterium]